MLDLLGHQAWTDPMGRLSAVTASVDIQIEMRIHKCIVIFSYMDICELAGRKMDRKVVKSVVCGFHRIEAG